ncbi:MAG: hypothetical protein HQ513_08665 [Rhodospirillales bacterium]|nr:hypothetical protein [Rhodospirillales bacterium]
MATVYDFNVFRTARLMGNHSRELGGTARKVRALLDTLESIKELMLENQKVLSRVNSNLESHFGVVDETLEFIQLCEEACGLDDIDEMTACYHRLAERNR